MKKILVVSAHSADWCTRSGGTLLRYIDDGAEVSLIILTFGEHGESGEWWRNHPDGNIEDCKKCRKEEILEAAEAMGISRIKFLDYGDYPLVFDHDRIVTLNNEILDIRPEIIITHYNNDPFNVDHSEAANAVIRSITCAGMLGQRPNTERHFIPDTYMFECSLPHTEFSDFVPNVYIDIDETYERKIKAVSKFKCQPHLTSYYERCAVKRGEQANDILRGRRPVKYAEAFVSYFPYVGTVFPESH